MKHNFKKIALVFCISLLVVAALAVTAFAERSEFPDSGYTDITPANGWVLVATPDAKPDDDGKDIDLYKISSAAMYYNAEKKTVAIIGEITNELAGYGDWNGAYSNKMNMPGTTYMASYWATVNSKNIEHLEIRDSGFLRCFGYLTWGMDHVVDVKLGGGVDRLVGSKSDTGIFVGMESLTTVGHGTFAKDGTFTPTSYKEGVVDLTGFTRFTPLGSSYDGKSVCYFGAALYSCPAVTEVILPKTLEGVGSYTPSVNVGGTSWTAGTETIECATDEWGGQYAGIIAKAVCYGTSSLSKVTIPEGVTVKLIETKAFAGSSVRCITILGKVDPEIEIASDAFLNVAKGCIIQCATQEDIDNMNKALEAQGITSVKAVDMNTQPAAVAKVTKLPVAPAWTEFDPATSGATAYGSIKGTYSDNWWAYFQDTKTLKIFAKKSSSYNEVGSISGAEDGVGWTQYKEEIEHVVIGPKIHKLSAAFAAGMINLKDIEMTTDIHQAAGAFTDNAKLTTIFLTGMEKVEGQAMLAGAKSNFKLSFVGSGVQSINMGSSAWAFIGNITPGSKTSTLIFDAPSDEIIAYCEENYLNIKNSGGESYGEWYVEVPEGLPSCGDTAVYDFDKTTGTLTILGKGAIGDTANYWGGGSKNQFWFDIKNDIKHVVISDYITTIGKYAFTECENLETVQLPAKEGFVILNAAFEKCYNLKSVYIKGGNAIEGTADVSVLDDFETYMFSDCYLIANVVIGENVKKIGSSVFENCVNIQNIYGVPGSYAEEYAKSNELTFFDKAANTPQPITCTPPSDETSAPETSDTVAPETSDTIAPETSDTVAPETTGAPVTTDVPVGGNTDDDDDEGGSNILPIIIVIAVVVVVAIVVVVVIIAKKKAPKAEEKKDKE